MTRPTSAPDVPLLAAALAEERSLLLEAEVYALLASAGLAVPRHHEVQADSDIDRGLCEALGTEQVVLKVVSPDLMHKSDVGGVVVCENTPSALREARSRILAAVSRARPEARIRGLLACEKVAHAGGPGRELLAGFRHDPAFGPVVVLGVGGLDAEALMKALLPEQARAVFHAEGLARDVVAARLRQTLFHGFLTGRMRSAREGDSVGEEALVDLVMALGSLARRYASLAPDAGVGLAELEINPVVLARDGRLVALDGLARVHHPQPCAPPRPQEALARLLRPQSAVVIGASAEGSNVGRTILRNLLAGGGVPKDKLWAIHPRAKEIDGCAAFADASALPERPDLAVVALPADRGAGEVTLDLVSKARARSVTLISGGFAETEAGRGIEAALRAAIERSRTDADGGVVVNGGNCLGIISEPGRYNTFFIPRYKLPFPDAPVRHVAAISQSGAYLVTLISNLERAVRPRYAISFGNQVDLSVADYLEHLAADPEVRVFAAYVEGFRRGDGLRFLDIARRLEAEGRTVLLYKAGRSAEGSAAAASHTAAAVGDYAVSRELCRAAGVIDCNTLNMFEDYLLTFAFLEGRQVTGPRVAILSNAGFECTAAADRLYGLEIASLAPATLARLTALLPKGVIDAHNPVDATPVTPTDRYAALFEALLADDAVDAVVVGGVPATPALDDLPAGLGHGEDILGEDSLPQRLIRIFRESRKPIVFSVDAGPLYDPFALAMLRAGLPTFRKIDRATRALAAFTGVFR
ncbi:MAG: acetate--CoA ligase family protein [Vicinamibacteria bacterium]|nr:acetate--CoA ligase family protein [Vicinamibacteria bacterium]